jgi:hypothetical protein
MKTGGEKKVDLKVCTFSPRLKIPLFPRRDPLSADPPHPLWGWHLALSSDAVDVVLRGGLVSLG